MEPTNREFILVYSQEEMRSKIEEMKTQGFRGEDIHVLVDDEAVLSAEDTSRLDIQETGTVGNKFKSFFTGTDAVRNEMKNLDLEQRQIDLYQEELGNGAILLYTERLPSSTNRTAAATDASYNNDRDEIFTSGVPREEQYGLPKYGDKSSDSRIKGENIHPTTGAQTADETAPKEKLMEHEPGIASGEATDVLDQGDGVNRREDEQSPGIDPNLGPAPFGRDSEEEHLLNDQRDDYKGDNNSRDRRPFDVDGEKKKEIPPSPRLF